MFFALIPPRGMSPIKPPSQPQPSQLSLIPSQNENNNTVTNAVCSCYTKYLHIKHAHTYTHTQTQSKFVQKHSDCNFTFHNNQIQREFQHSPCIFQLFFFHWRIFARVNSLISLKFFDRCAELIWSFSY